jgi:hypothetical protein
MGVCLTTGTGGFLPASLFSFAEDLRAGQEIPLDEAHVDIPSSSSAEEVPDWEPLD